MVSLENPLDLNDPQATLFLAGIQGNILKSHGRDHADHIFLKFGEDAQEMRSWIAKMAEYQATSARKQREDSRAWKASGRSAQQPFISILLSYDGYRALGFA